MQSMQWSSSKDKPLKIVIVGSCGTRHLIHALAQTADVDLTSNTSLPGKFSTPHRHHTPHRSTPQHLTPHFVVISPYKATFKAIGIKPVDIVVIDVEGIEREKEREK